MVGPAVGPAEGVGGVGKIEGDVVVDPTVGLAEGEAGGAAVVASPKEMPLWVLLLAPRRERRFLLNSKKMPLILLLALRWER